MGRARELARWVVAHGVDFVGRNLFRRHEGWPSPSLWDMTQNSPGHLCVRGHDLVTIAEACGTPLHVVDEVRLERNLRGFLDAFRRHYSRVEVACSYKTNPLPGVLQRLHAWGAWAEVISHFELWLALRLGVPPDRIIYNGPGKTRESLDVAVEQKIAVINIDGHSEIDLIENVAEKHGVTQSVGIRVVTSVGWSDQFGLPIANGAAHEAARRLRGCRHVDLAGLHLHLGTGIADVTTYVTAIREVVG